LLEVQLTVAGFAVATVEGGAQALDALNPPPDAIVSDVLMDEMDGFSLCDKLRKIPNIDGIPIILLSTYFDELADRALAEQVGANALVARTPSMQACIEAIVLGLADGMGAKSSTRASELHLRRVAHHLVRSRKETRSAEARYHAIFDNANDAMSLLTPDGYVVDVNQRWEAIMQRPREELIGLHIRDFSASGHEDENVRRYHRSSTRDVDRAGPVPIQRADGSVIHLEFTTAKIVLDGQDRILGIGRDVTEVMESRKKLEASERKYRSLVENIPEVLFSASMEQRLTFVSSNVLGMCGYTPEEMLDPSEESPLARIHPEDSRRFFAALEAAAKGEGPMDVEYRWQHRDFHWMWMRCRAALAEDENGVPCIDGVFADVSARKHLEDQLAHAQKIEAIGQLTAGIAHDFNNILSVILANAEILVAELTAADHREIADEIGLAGRRGADLTKHLLDFARRETAEPRDTDLNRVVDGVERMLVCTLGSTRKLRVNQQTNLGAIRADVRQLEQVLMNLTVNARDAMPRGGNLTIETFNVGSEAARKVEGVKLAPGEYVALRVSDEGIGMDAETRARLFEPFFTTKGERGTGLGLSTSYGIVRRYGGHISVESTPDEGTTFTLYFPRCGERPLELSRCA
jgi:two-component system, cell cycle sensor histidine kinase and response regulator CckA